MKIFKRLFAQKHFWSLIGTTSTDPQAVSDSIIDKIPERVLEKLLFGTTTYIWEDRETQDIRREECLGTDETPLRQLISRVDIWGKYEIVVDGKRYVIVKLVDEPQPIQLSETSSPIQRTEPMPDISQLPVR